MGSVCYLDAWDVRRGRVIGRSEPKGGIEPFDRLVCQVMTKEPYARARARVRAGDEWTRERPADPDASVRKALLEDRAT